MPDNNWSFIPCQWNRITGWVTMGKSWSVSLFIVIFLFSKELLKAPSSLTFSFISGLHEVSTFCQMFLWPWHSSVPQAYRHGVMRPRNKTYGTRSQNKAFLFGNTFFSSICDKNKQWINSQWTHMVSSCIIDVCIPVISMIKLNFSLHFCLCSMYLR
jgi:hypothetical protein